MKPGTSYYFQLNVDQAIYLQVRLFTLMDWPILDAICDKLRQNLYISGSDILYQGGPVDKMVFIVRGKLESVSADGSKAPLHDGDVCGEELLTWYLEQSSVNRGMQFLPWLVAVVFLRF